VIEIDAATNRGIDEIRELREAARYRPARDRFKIYILDEAHQITDAAFNALLKTLEEPPDHIVFMLATTQPEDIPQTIRSRCQHFSFRAVKFDAIVGQLRDLVGREKIEADDDALALLAEAGDGSMRDALSILDQAIASSNGRITADSVRDLVGAAPSHVLEERDAGHRSEALAKTCCGWLTISSAKGTAPRILHGRWCAFCAMPRLPRLRVKTLPCCRFRVKSASAWSVSRAVWRRRSHASFADHAAHPRRTGLQAGAAFSSGTRAAKDGACATPVAHRATAQRSGRFFECFRLCGERAQNSRAAFNFWFNCERTTHRGSCARPFQSCFAICS
jgi:hypothetical protein